VCIAAESLAPNSKRNAYAVWLYNSAADAQLLGLVNPGVGRDGRLQTSGFLPGNAKRFHHLVISLETRTNPKRPHHIVLTGHLGPGALP
jgi:hypothetical protein